MSAVRVSPLVFEEAKREAQAMSRSVAGQLEHWARLGQAVEALGLSPNDVKQLLYQRMAAADPLSQPGWAGDPKHAKLIRQKIEQSAQTGGLLAASRVSPFAGAAISARIREVPLDE
ncbi:MAG TPA: hypothetical protein VMN03_05540 [Burkholderiales bacterium]|nr:hypothetical protein [Burkholderiales bacterium]